MGACIGPGFDFRQLHKFIIMYYSRNEIEARKLGYYVTRSGVLVNKTGQAISTKLKTDGYKQIMLRKTIGGKTHHKALLVHRLQAYQKYGDLIYSPGVVVRHLDNNKENNSWDNIMIGTVHDNAMDNPPGQRKRMAANASMNSPKRYPKDKIKQIKCDLLSGMSYGEVMRKYGIKSKGTISYIKHHDYYYTGS